MHVVELHKHLVRGDAAAPTRGGQVVERRVRKHQAEADDLVLEGAGQRVVVDPVSLPYLAGAVIDFADELIGARFTIDNPNATSSCGCGTSFSM
ncbi:MAG: iron-sulfur cluster assembly accessory protein [Paracoccus sp. (in: a-proteobacteria)]